MDYSDIPATNNINQNNQSKNYYRRVKEFFKKKKVSSSNNVKAEEIAIDEDIISELAQIQTEDKINMDKVIKLYNNTDHLNDKIVEHKLDISEEEQEE
ncbi:MAG: hypothetical protein ACK4OM_02115 [Alphaproteobacteria bacterium]